MAKVYLTDEHYFLCSGGLFPARIYDGKSTHVSKTGKHYLTHYDTATKTPDFTCRWAVVLAVMAAVFFALLASNPIGWAILAGLIIGLGISHVWSNDGKWTEVDWLRTAPDYQKDTIRPDKRLLYGMPSWR